MEHKIRATSDVRSESIDDTLKFLNASTGGLSESDARERLRLYGTNEIVEKKKSPVLEFLKRYWGPMPWLLELAMLLSFALGHDLEAIIIIVLLTANAIIGFLHARGSSRAVELLKRRLALTARVLRDGEWSDVEARVVVPGDVLVVRLGDIIPADAKIIDGEISVDESALTGESLPAERTATEVIYSGAVVRRGEARCVVVNTAANTYFGKTAELVKIAKPKSHQEEIMMAVVRYMMYLGIAASLLVAVYAALIHLSFLLILTFIVVFLLGAIPVALPAVITIVQAATGVRLAREGVLVTRLDSIEDAASISVLCMDKTGTLTQNELRVADIAVFGGFAHDEVVRSAALASRAEGADPIDAAVLGYAKSSRVEVDFAQQVSYTPFSPETKRTEAVVTDFEGRHRVTKGAVPIIVPMCAGSEGGPDSEVDAVVHGLSQKGYRTIAVARSEDGGSSELRLMGLISLSDFPRPDSKEMIARLRRYGVKPIMLTGDSDAIAREISREVGIGDRIVPIARLAGESDSDQVKSIGAIDGFAEIYPEDKYRIVKLLQSQGFMVGMTGDGVNDAPALKQAEMGIAVSNATDVAKAAASVVLTEPGVAVIVQAIRRSRETYQRMLTWVINKVTKVVQVIGLLTLSFFLLHQMVLTLLGMALLIFANDFVTMSLASDNVERSANPNTWNVKNISLASLAVGGLLVIEGILVVLWGAFSRHLGLPELQTLVLLMLVFTSQARVLVVRERGHFWASAPGRALVLSSIGATALFVLIGTFGVIVPPLPFDMVVEVLGFSAAFTLLMDFPKYLIFKAFRLE